MRQYTTKIFVSIFAGYALCSSAESSQSTFLMERASSALQAGMCDKKSLTFVLEDRK